MNVSFGYNNGLDIINSTVNFLHNSRTQYKISELGLKNFTRLIKWVG